jgi:predicted RNase H-like HicB family nuclease
MHKKDLNYYEALPYRVDLYFDQEDQVWVARYPELPGCLAHGNTKEEALINGDEMKLLWLETAIKNGDMIPEPQPEPSYSGKFVLRLPKTLHEHAAQAAEQEGVSLNQYLVSTIAMKLGAEGLFNRLLEKLRWASRPLFQTNVMFTYTAAVSTGDANVVTLNLKPPVAQREQVRLEAQHG